MQYLQSKIAGSALMWQNSTFMHWHASCIQPSYFL